MGALTVSVCAAIAGMAVAVLRRRIASKWIDLRSVTSYDVAGKVIVITGGNVGLGFETAMDLARRNARIVIGCRNISKGREAVRAIKDATGNEAVDCLELDLASLASTRKFASEIKSKYPSIHALVLNAGVWVPMEEGRKTNDGFEIHFGVNHLGHYELAQSLVEHLAKSGDSRIVFVSSSLLKSGTLDFEKQDFVREGRQIQSEDDKKFFPPLGYCDSKLLNVLTCRHLATILPPEVTAYAVCPGFCRSSLGRHVSFPIYKKILITPVFLMIQRTAVQGAQNIIFATIEEKDKLRSGAVYRDGVILEEETDHVETFVRSEAPKKLWDLSENLARKV